MSGLFEIYINHTLSKTQLMEIDKILIDNCNKYLESFYECNKLSYPINIEVKPYISTYRFSLKQDEVDLPIFNKSNQDSKEWIKDVLDLNKAIEVTIKPFTLIIGNYMLQINILADLYVLLYKKNIETFQSIRKFVFNIAKLFNNNEFKAFYIFNESEYFESKYFNIYFDELFYSISYRQMYNLLLSFEHDKLSSIRDIEKWIKNDHYPSVIIDDFRDLKELDRNNL
jgi:hypothetical protein